MMELLHELLKNSKKSDRNLAKTLNCSQPTITRMRKRLEKMGFISEYTIIPNLVKMGFEIAAYTFMNISQYGEKGGASSKRLAERAHKWILENPKIVFASPIEGPGGKNCMMVTMHKNFTDFSEFISDFRSKWPKNIKDIETFIAPAGSRVIKPFSFRYLEKVK